MTEQWEVEGNHAPHAENPATTKITQLIPKEQKDVKKKVTSNPNHKRCSHVTQAELTSKALKTNITDKA